MTYREHAPTSTADTTAGAAARAVRTRSMPADAEAVFDVVTDLEHLAAWLPAGVEVELYGPGLLRLWPRGGARDEPRERQVRIDWEDLRVQWGGDAATYAGSLRVLRMAPGRSAVAVELTGPAGMAVSSLDGWLTEALDALALVVGAERPHLPLGLALAAPSPV
ncbi:SRPBCC family protein [Saccharothrix sp. HUAS TT1]|uniref:SRPBCC family protein n=1 Tax=unclassified Saccharothrix TaxID=2593673 RepID=UPI00345B7594